MEPYDDEIEFYKVLFSKKKLFDKFEKNKLPEKEYFISLLTKILDIFKKCIETESLIELNKFKNSMPKRNELY